MSEEKEENDWFGSFFNAVKIKGTEVLSLVKNDIEELGNAVKSEASNVVSSTSSAIEKTMGSDTASTVKKSMSSFFDQVNNVFNPKFEESDSEDVLIYEGAELVEPTKLQKAIIDIQNDENSYLIEPEDTIKQVFQCWLELNEEQLTEEKIDKHLKNSVILQKHFRKLVPAKVSPRDFWRRYFFKKALVEDEINREQEKLEREKCDVVKEVTELEKSHELIEWEQEDFSNNIELSEEEQIKLLEEYENETKSRLKVEKKTNNNNNNNNLQDEISTTVVVNES